MFLNASQELFVAEMVNVFAALLTYWALGNKKRYGWLFYLVSSIALVYVLWHKNSMMSVINQGMMSILAIKNFFLFHKPKSKIHRSFESLTFAIFLSSFALIRGWDGRAISEVLLWSAIIGKTLLLGKKNTSGWYFQLLQQALSIIFGLYQEIYLYALKGAVFVLQGIWGLRQWRRTAPRPATG
ncbi:MAG: nicotinamide mononucleotide transporter [Bacteroidota bacterium]